MANTFVELNDTPSNYTGSGAKYLQVDGPEGNVIFNNIDLNNLADVNAPAPGGNQVLQWVSAANEWRAVTYAPYSAGNGINFGGTGYVINAVAGSGGGLTSNTSGIYITDIANVSGTYGNATYTPQLTVNSKGQITGVAEVQSSITLAESLNASYVGNVIGTSGQITVTGGTGINSNATLNLVATGVTAGIYGNATAIPKITVDSYGRISSVDVVDVVASGGSGNADLSNVTTLAYSNIHVSGQTSLGADKKDDDLTFAGGLAIDATTDANNDTISFALNPTDAAANMSISGFSDVDASGITNGQALIWNSSTSKFEAGNVSGGSGNSNVTLTDFSVTTATPSGNGSLTYDNAGVFTFTPADTSSGGISNAGVDAHLNVSGASTNDVLSWNGSDYVWVAQTGGSTQSLSWESANSNLTISSGNSVDLSALSQTLSVAGNVITISGSSDTVDLTSALGNVAGNYGDSNVASYLSVNGYSNVDNDAQTLSLSANILTISGSNSSVDVGKTRFYYANQTDFPNATTYHGAIAHSHSDGAMYFAHGGSWNKLANDSDLSSYQTIVAATTANTNMQAYVDALETRIIGGANVSLDSLAEVANALANSNTELSTVAFTGAYSDVTGTPTLALSGNTYLTLDGANIDLSGVVGQTGAQGPQGNAGIDGTDGVSVTNATISSDNLVLTLSNASTIDAGNVRGPQGDQGVAGGTFVGARRKINTGFTVDASIQQISTASYVRDFSISEHTSLRSLAFSTDGTKLYTLGSVTVKQYNLSSAFDLSTASYSSNTLDVSTQESAPTGITLSPDGTKLWVVGEDAVLYQYTLSSPFDLSTASYSSVNKNISSGSLGSGDATGLAFNSTGTKMYLVEGFAAIIYQWTLSTAYDITSASYDNVSYDAGTPSTHCPGIAFNTDGSKLYVIGASTSDTVYQHSLSTKFDISTATYDSDFFAFGSQDNEPEEMVFNSDGTKMFVIGDQNDKVYEYSLPAVSTGQTVLSFSNTASSYDTNNFANVSGNSFEIPSNSTIAYGEVYAHIDIFNNNTDSVLSGGGANLVIKKNNVVVAETGYTDNNIDGHIHSLQLTTGIIATAPGDDFTFEIGNPNSNVVLSVQDSTSFIGFHATVTGTTAQGPQGNVGADGVGITSSALVGGNLTLTYSNTSTQDIGNIQGPQGVQGTVGATGVGVDTATVTGSNLIITLSNASTIDAGNVEGPQGATGATGPQGPAGNVLVTTANAAPSGASEGQMWYATDDGHTYIYYNNAWVQANPGQDPQTLSLVGNVLTISGSNSNVDFTSALNVDTDAQDLTLSGNVISLTGQSGNVDLTSLLGAYINTDSQTLSVNDASNVITITGGNTIDLSNVLANASGATSLLNLTDVGSDGTNGQVLTTDGNGSFTFTTVSGGGGSGDITSVIAGVGLTGGASTGDATIDLANTAVTPGTYGSATKSARITVDQQGRITGVAESTISGGGGGGGAGIERFKLNYASNGNLAGTSDLTSGISGVTVNSATGGEVSITFDSGTYNLPPGSIMFYGYDYTNNKYSIVPFETSMGYREIDAGGSSGSPTLFNGASTLIVKLRLREAETGASRGGFGTTTHAWIQFVMSD